MFNCLSRLHISAAPSKISFTCSVFIVFRLRKWRWEGQIRICASISANFYLTGLVLIFRLWWCRSFQKKLNNPSKKCYSLPRCFWKQLVNFLRYTVFCGLKRTFWSCEYRTHWEREEFFPNGLECFELIGKQPGKVQSPYGPSAVYKIPKKNRNWLSHFFFVSCIKMPKYFDVWESLW